MRYLTYIFPLVLLFFTACGGGSKDQNQAENNQNSSKTQATNQQSSDVRTIDIIGIDKMKFVVKEEGEMLGTAGTVETPQGDSYILLESIDVKPGEKIHIRLTAKSKLPAQAMSHNFVLLKRSADAEAFDKAAQKAKDNDYIPSDMSDQILAHTDMAAGGETVEVTFTAPEESGENTYMCSFPAHFSAGMKGTLNVQ